MAPARAASSKASRRSKGRKGKGKKGKKGAKRKGKKGQGKAPSALVVPANAWWKEAWEDFSNSIDLQVTSPTPPLYAACPHPPFPI